MYQITYDRQLDQVVASFPWQDQDRSFVESLEQRGEFSPIQTGDLCLLNIAPTPWNAGLIRKHCTPVALTPAARTRLEQAATPSADRSNKQDETPVITDWQFSRVPFRHQVISWKYAIDNPYSALFLDMGLGKTYVVWQILAYFLQLKQSSKPSVVVIPLSSFETWEREARLCGYAGKVVPVLGGRSRKIELLSGEGDVFLVTYESLTTLLEVAMKRDWLYIVLDESTKIKNCQALRSKTLYSLATKSERRIILTGYPITQSYVDLYGQYRFLDPSIFGTSFHHFRHRYCVMGGWNDKQIIGYTNLRELTEQMNRRCIRFTKKECLDLPEKIYQTLRFDLDTNEQKAYDELKRQLVLKMEGGGKVSAQNALVAGLRLVQICTGYVGGVEQDASDSIDSSLPMFAIKEELGKSKMNLLKETLENVPEGEHVIIWCRFRHNIQQVEEVLRSINWTSVVFTGSLTSEQRKIAIEEFQAGKHRAFVGILQAGGHGLDLTRASYVVYYSQDYSIERRMQSEDRAHRIGQKKNVTYIDLVARHTIEDSILKCLHGKKKESEVLAEFARDPGKFFGGGFE